MDRSLRSLIITTSKTRIRLAISSFISVYYRNFNLLAPKGHDVEVGYSYPEVTVSDLQYDTREFLRDQLPARHAVNDSKTVVSSVVEDRLGKRGYK